MNNRQTIAAYYAQHRDEIVGFVALRLGGSNVSEDIVQDIFVRLLQSDKLISPTTLPALVFTMARNAVADWYRRHRVHEEYEHYLKLKKNIKKQEQAEQYRLRGWKSVNIRPHDLRYPNQNKIQTFS